MLLGATVCQRMDCAIFVEANLREGRAKRVNPPRKHDRNYHSIEIDSNLWCGSNGCRSLMYKNITRPLLLLQIEIDLEWRLRTLAVRAAMATKCAVKRDYRIMVAEMPVET